MMCVWTSHTPLAASCGTPAEPGPCPRLRGRLTRSRGASDPILSFLSQHMSRLVSQTGLGLSSMRPPAAQAPSCGATRIRIVVPTSGVPRPSPTARSTSVTRMGICTPSAPDYPGGIVCGMGKPGPIRVACQPARDIISLEKLRQVSSPCGPAAHRWPARANRMRGWGAWARGHLGRVLAQ